MRLGLFGGSFDPVHSGHVLPVIEALDRFGLDRVIYLPTAHPPHKPGHRFAPAHARYAMVEIALLDRPELVVSPFELTLDRPAYTIETLEHFRRERPEAELYLLIGGDSFAALESWRRWREIVDMAQLVVLVRPGWEIQRARLEWSDELSRLADDPRVHFLDNRAVEISSTDLRERLARGEAASAGSMPASVLQYINKYSLYR